MVQYAPPFQKPINKFFRKEFEICIRGKYIYRKLYLYFLFNVLDSLKFFNW